MQKRKNRDICREKKSKNNSALRDGIRDGIPIALGYFAVAFSLGIAAKNAGLDAFEGALASLLCNASAGEYAGFSYMREQGAVIGLVLLTVVVNARYFLMSCALGQKLSPKTRFWQRVLLCFYLTDEFFGIAVARPGYLDPSYVYGAVMVASPAWALGTALGVLAGTLLPVRVVSAFSVALYGMFLAIMIPPARKSRVIAGLVAIGFALSYAASALPVVRDLSEGMRTLLLTLLLSAAAALLFPRREEAATDAEGQATEHPTDISTDVPADISTDASRDGEDKA